MLKSTGFFVHQTLLQPNFCRTCLRHLSGSSGNKIYDKLRKRLPQEADLGGDLPEHVYEGKHHQLGLRLYVWGSAISGALGKESYIYPDHSKKQTYIKTKVNPLRSEFGEVHKVVDVSCGYGFTAFAVNSKGCSSLYGTGINSNGQIGHHKTRRETMLVVPYPVDLPLRENERVIKVSCGRAHTLALTNTGAVYTLGNNSLGQCGRPVRDNEDYSAPRSYSPVQGLPNTIVAVEAGQDTSFFLCSTGAVYSCGWAADGQTGQGHYATQAAVGVVGGDLLGERVTQISCRADCVLALTARGDVMGWGNSEYQQLSAVTEEAQLHTPRRLSSLPHTVVSVAASGSACLAVTSDGDVLSWGYGLLGRGVEEVFNANPQLIPSTLLGRNVLSPNTKVVSVSCGVHTAGAITDTGDVFTWGKNPGGVLGQGHKHRQDFPMKVGIQAQTKKLSCGVDHMAAIARQI